CRRAARTWARREAAPRIGPAACHGLEIPALPCPGSSERRCAWRSAAGRRCPRSWSLRSRDRGTGPARPAGSACAFRPFSARAGWPVLGGVALPREPGYTRRRQSATGWHLSPGGAFDGHDGNICGGVLARDGLAAGVLERADPRGDRTGPRARVGASSPADRGDRAGPRRTVRRAADRRRAAGLAGPRFVAAALSRVARRSQL